MNFRQRLVGCLGLWLALILASAAWSADPVRNVRYVPLTPYEQREGYKHVAVFADRKVYWNDDRVGQFLANFIGTDAVGKPAKIEVLDEVNAVVGERLIGPLTEPKAAMLIGVGALKPGRYTFRATLMVEPPVMAETTFIREDNQNAPVPFPRGGVVIEVEPQSYIKDGAYPICTGIPFPQGVLTDAGNLWLIENGKPVPCQIDKVETWHPETTRIPSSIRWVHLNFAARYRDGKPATYRLGLLAARRSAAGPKSERNAG